MAAVVPIIDLDVAGPPRDAPGRRRPRLAPSRPLVVAAVALLALIGLGPAEAPAPGLRLVLAANGTAAAAFTLGANALYTASFGISNPNSESAIRRFDLTTGSQSWATALPQGVQNLVVNDGAGVLMARSGTDPRSSFLDARTGAVLWRTEPANTSVLTLNRSGALIRTDEAGGTELRLADARTGRVTWSRHLPERVQFGPDSLWSGEPERIIAVGMAGSVTTLDFRSGAVLSQGDLGGSVQQPDWSDTVGENRLVVSRGGLVRTYSVVPFRLLWDRRGVAANPVSECGPVWCLMRDDPPAVEGIDPASGATRWRITGTAFAWQLDDHLLAGLDVAEEPRMSLLDPATGQVVRRLGAVIRVGDLLLRTDRKRFGQAWVSVLDPTGTPRTVGRIDSAVPHGCDGLDRYLACPTTDGPTKVWRVP